MSLRTFLVICSLTWAVAACQSPTKTTHQDEGSTTPSGDVSVVEAPKTAYAVETYSTGVGQWGYRILDGGKLVINQPHIPAIQGDRGFSSPEKAETAAWFVVEKMKAGIMPPAVTQKELDSLGVL